jgi:hypothetical protein
MIRKKKNPFSRAGEEAKERGKRGGGCSRNKES